jgi:predicted secreted protein
MNWVSAIVVYVIIWWLVFFMTLPFGVKPPHEVGEVAEPGHSDGAPVKPRLWLKAAITTGIAALLWGVAFYLITSDLLSFRRP